MSGWNDPNKLAEARAAHAAFTSRSPDSRGHGARGGRAGTGAGGGRGRGSASPSPARNVNNPINNMFTAGRGRGNPPTPARGGPGGFGGNHTAWSGGTTARNGSAAPLATSDEFYAFVNNKKKTTVSTGGSAAVSSTNGTHGAPISQKTVAQDANIISGGGPMELDQPAQSRNTATDPPSPGRSLMASRWGDQSGVSKAAQGNGVTDNSGTPMDIDDSKNTQSKTGTNHGLFASRWAESPRPLPTNPSELAPVYRSEDWIKDLEEDNEAEVKRRSALASAATPGHAHSDALGPNTEPAMRTPAASSVGALVQTRANNRPAQDGASVTASIGTSNQANIRAQPAARPAPTSGVSMQGQAHNQRPDAIQSGTQPVGQQSVGFGQRPVGAAQPASGPSQSYQPPAVRPLTHGQPQQAQGAAAHPAIEAQASLNSQPLQRGGSGAAPSFAGFGSGPTAQSVRQPGQSIGNIGGQQLPQAAHPSGGDTGQQSAQSAQSAQSSQDPFNDAAFKDFWDNHYLPNNR